MKKRIVSQGLTGVLAAAMVLGSVVMPLNVQAEESTEDTVVEVVLAEEVEEDVIAVGEVTEENTVIEDESLTEEDAENVEVEMQEYVLENSPDTAQVKPLGAHHQEALNLGRFLAHKFDAIMGVYDREQLRWGGATFNFRAYAAELKYLMDHVEFVEPFYDGDEERKIESLTTHVNDRSMEIDPVWNVVDQLQQIQSLEWSPSINSTSPLTPSEYAALDTYLNQLVNRLATQESFTPVELDTISDELWNILQLNYIPGYGAIGTGANNNTANNATTNNTTTTNNAETQSNASTQSDTTGKSAKVTAPNTGDMANAIMYTGLALLAIGAIATVAIRKKRVA